MPGTQVRKCGLCCMISFLNCAIYFVIVQAAYTSKRTFWEIGRMRSGNAGEELHFYKELKRKGLLPSKTTNANAASPTHGKVVTTPFLFSPVRNDDVDGHRTYHVIDLQNFSEGIRLTELDTGLLAGDRLKKGITYKIECWVSNKGAAAWKFFYPARGTNHPDNFSVVSHKRKFTCLK